MEYTDTLIVTGSKNSFWLYDDACIRHISECVVASKQRILVGIELASLNNDFIADVLAYNESCNTDDDKVRNIFDIWGHNQLAGTKGKGKG